jgi:hypothetical protein
LVVATGTGAGGSTRPDNPGPVFGRNRPAGRCMRPGAASPGAFPVLTSVVPVRALPRSGKCGCDFALAVCLAVVLVQRLVRAVVDAGPYIAVRPVAACAAAATVSAFIRSDQLWATYAGLALGFIGVYPVDYVIPLTTKPGFNEPLLLRPRAATARVAEISDFSGQPVGSDRLFIKHPLTQRELTCSNGSVTSARSLQFRRASLALDAKCTGMLLVV